MDLGKQVGPMPLGAWYAVVGTGLGIAWYTRRNAAPSTPSTDPLAAPIDPTSQDAVGTGPGWVAVPPPTTGPAAPITDNDSWGNAAINFLISRGMDPGLSQSAIAHALQGDPMSIREFALWSLAIGGIGPPPFAVSVLPPTSVPTPVTPTAPPPSPGPAPSAVSGQKFVIDGAHKTLHTLAHRFYGNASEWRKIFDANRKGVRRPNGMHPGWLTDSNPDHALPMGRVLWIPR